MAGSRANLQKVKPETEMYRYSGHLYESIHSNVRFSASLRCFRGTAAVIALSSPVWYGSPIPAVLEVFIHSRAVVAGSQVRLLQGGDKYRPIHRAYW